MHALERNYWWFQGRRRVILSILEKFRKSGNGPATVLDIGCGTGMLLEDLQKLGLAVGLDFSMVALEYCRQRGLKSLAQADVRYIPVKSGSVDIITALDLIEHIKDDHGLMAEFFRVLKPGGIAIMSVPAHKSLWSGHDVALHHFRRYEKSEFLALVKGAGLQPTKYSYGMATAFFPAMVFRRAKNLLLGPSSDSAVKTDEFRLPGWVNTVLRKTVEAEARWLTQRNLPFGLSLLCVAEKPEASQAVV